MRNRLQWDREQLIGANSRLESRSLLSGGMSDLGNIVRDLGTVTGSAATSGVEATAMIAAQSSVTFRFNLRDAGDYTLLVRHAGEGLTLEARTPAGIAAVDPGVAGPFQVVPLRLDSATYEITASARSERSVYVDWELLLTNGVGQSAAATIAPLLVPMGAAPPSLNPPLDLLPAAVTSSASLVGLASPPAETTQPASSPIYLASRPVGRLSLEATPPLAAVARMPETTDPSTTLSRGELDSALCIALQASQHVEGSHPENRAEHSWFDDFWVKTDPELIGAPQFADEPITPEADLARMLGESTPPETARQRISLASISPGLALGALAVTVAARSRIKRTPRWFDRGQSSRSLASSVEPTFQRLRAVFERSYRPDRCQPVRPLHPSR